MKKADLNLLVEISSAYAKGEFRQDLSDALEHMILREKEKMEKTRESNRIRADKNRKDGYAWKSSYHPKKSKYHKKTT